MNATPLRRGRSPAVLLGEASDGGSEGMAWPDPMIDFAELDAHNWLSKTIPNEKTSAARATAMRACVRLDHMDAAHKARAASLLVRISRRDTLFFVCSRSNAPGPLGAIAQACGSTLLARRRLS